MVEFIKDNPVTLGRFRAQEAQRAQNQDARLEEQGFQQRYAHDTQVGVDRAVRTALGGFNAGQPPTPNAQPTNAAPMPAGGMKVGAQPTAPATNRAWARTPGFNPGGGAQNQRLIRELSKVEGGGAEALRRFSQDQTRQNKRTDALEDKAWSMFSNAKHPADLEMANSMYKQATGQDLPPQWRTKQAVLKAGTVDAAARERYPRDIVQRRKFIEVGMTQGLEVALRQMAGESVVTGKLQMTPKQVYDMAVKAHTIEDPATLIKSTDWGKVQASMDSYGFGDQGRAIIGGGVVEAAGAGPGMDTKMAMGRARAEADSQAGLFSTDATDFKADGGNREAFITRRTQQIMAGLENQGSQPQAEAPEVRQASASTAPQDPAQRVVGQVYRSPNGQLGEWTGQGWRIVEGGAGQDVSTGDPAAPVDNGYGPAQPSTSLQTDVDPREARRIDAEAELQAAVAEMNQLIDENMAREAMRTEAAQNGHSVPQFDHRDKQLQAAMNNAEQRISRAHDNLSSIMRFWKEPVAAASGTDEAVKGGLKGKHSQY